MSNVDQKWNWVQLKSVRILLRITYLAHRKSYVVLYVTIHVKNWPKVNWVKLKSIQILLKITSIIPRKSYLLIIYANSWQHARFRRYIALNTQLPRSDLCMSSKVKDHEVKWNINIWLYAFHVNFGHNMHRFWDISANRSRRPIFDRPDLEIDL